MYLSFYFYIGFPRRVRCDLQSLACGLERCGRALVRPAVLHFSQTGDKSELISDEGWTVLRLASWTWLGCDLDEDDIADKAATSPSGCSDNEDSSFTVSANDGSWYSNGLWLENRWSTMGPAQ